MVHLCLEWWQSVIENATRLEVIPVPSAGGWFRPTGLTSEVCTLTYPCRWLRPQEMMETSETKWELPPPLGEEITPREGNWLLCSKNWKLTLNFQEFPGSPVVTPPWASIAGGTGLIPSRGTKILQAVWPRSKSNKVPPDRQWVHLVDCPGNAVVDSNFQSREAGTRLIPGQGNNIPPAVWYNQKLKSEKKKTQNRSPPQPVSWVSVICQSIPWGCSLLKSGSRSERWVYLQLTLADFHCSQLPEWTVRFMGLGKDSTWRFRCDIHCLLSSHRWHPAHHFFFFFLTSTIRKYL